LYGRRIRVGLETEALVNVRHTGWHSISVAAALPRTVSFRGMNGEGNQR
jgi:hypothetical protein